MRCAGIVATLSIVAGCKDFGVEVPPDIPVARLLQTPDTITVEGKPLYLAAALGRDFFPSSPPNGRPLVAVIRLITTDRSQFPASVSADAIWIVFSTQVWRSYFTSEGPGLAPETPYQYSRIAREGPKWGPFVFVDVVVRVYDSHGNAQLLHVPNQWIGRSE